MVIYKKEELTNYHILKKIEQDENISQRMLSSQMGVNVASINFALKRLITKGLIKMIGVNPRRIRYIITPKGIKEKSELAYKFFGRNFHFYKDVRMDIENKIREISDGRNKKVAIYGTNELSEITCMAIQNMELELVGIFDGNAKKPPTKFLGREVFGLKNLKDKQPYIVLFTDTKDSDQVNSVAKAVGAIVIDLTGYYKV